MLTRTDAVPRRGPDLATIALNADPLLGGAGMGSAPADASSLLLPIDAERQFPLGPSIEGEHPVRGPAGMLVFSAGDQMFSVTDVVEAAWLRGDFQTLWQEFLSAEAVEQWAEEEGLEPESEVLQALSDQFRTEHDLITAEETESWLEARGLTLEDFNDYFHRQYWRQRATDAPSNVGRRDAVSSFLPVNPPLHPSQEGNLKNAHETKLPSREGLGVGSEGQCGTEVRGDLSLRGTSGERTEETRPPTATPSPPANVNYLDATPDDRQLFIKDVLFSGQFDDLARRLSWPVAASVVADRSKTLSSEQLDAERTRFFQKTCLAQLPMNPPLPLPGGELATHASVEAPLLGGAGVGSSGQCAMKVRGGLSECLGLIGRDEAWFETLVELEAGYRSHCDQLFTPENRERTLAALRLPLTRFQVEMMDLESADAAREAFLCLSSDGLSMEELAEQEGYVIEKRQPLLEEFPEERQQRFLSSETGQVLQLIDAEHRFQLCQVLAKSEPTLADEKVLKRVDAELLASHFGNLVSKHIVWLIGAAAPV